MRSKTVTDRIKRSREIEIALDSHVETTAQGLGERLTPFLEPGEELPDLPLLQRLLRRLLASRRQALLSADEVHARELDDDQRPRGELAEVIAAIRARLIDLRRVAGLLYGRRPAAALLGIERRTARSPVPLLRQAKRVAARLLDGETPVPAPRTRNIQADLTGWARELAVLAEELAQLIESTGRETAEEHGSGARRHQALGRFDRAVVDVVDLTAALYRFSGNEHLARRLGPAHARNLGRRPTGDETPDPGPSPATADRDEATGAEGPAAERSEPPPPPT